MSVNTNGAMLVCAATQSLRLVEVSTIYFIPTVPEIFTVKFPGLGDAGVSRAGVTWPDGNTVTLKVTWTRLSVLALLLTVTVMKAVPVAFFFGLRVRVAVASGLK